MAVITGSSNISPSFNQAVTAGVTSQQNLPGKISFNTLYSSGTGVSQMDLLYAKQVTFIASTPQTLTLSAIADLIAATVNMFRVREFYCQMVSGTLIIGAAGTHPWTPLWGATGTLTVFPGTTYGMSDPTSVGGSTGAFVTSGSSDQIKFDPGAAPAVANIIIGGCSAYS